MEAMNMLELQKAWRTLNKSLNLSPIHNRKEYDRMVLLADHLSDAIGDAKRHALLNLFEIVCELIRSYEKDHLPIDNPNPRDILEFLMHQHQLRQSDLPEIGNQSVVSQILSGTRVLNLRQIKAIAKRFELSANIFIEKSSSDSQKSTYTQTLSQVRRTELWAADHKASYQKRTAVKPVKNCSTKISRVKKV
jgi:HTH-type transcriptional regulator/antitoxin HigA